jgi:hypothetical protein
MSLVDFHGRKIMDKSKEHEMIQRMEMLIARVVDGGSCGGHGDCCIPGWLHDMMVQVLQELEDGRKK